VVDAGVNVSGLPGNTRASFQELGRLLISLAGDHLLGLSAFGGWLNDDPLYRGTPARSVAVLERFDLKLLDRIACEGVRLGKRGLAAPLIMTPEYIAASRDVFPLELMEIQHLNVLLHGRDCFGTLEFQQADVRLQCERELKSELIHLRQALLTAGGEHQRLGEPCRQAAERATRVLRGVLYLAAKDAPRPAAALVERCAEATGLKVDALRQVVLEAGRVDFGGFERFYGDLTALAEYVDRLTG
jgi:hypothetical protein